MLKLRTPLHQAHCELNNFYYSEDLLLKIEKLLESPSDVKIT